MTTSWGPFFQTLRIYNTLKASILESNKVLHNGKTTNIYRLNINGRELIAKSIAFSPNKKNKLKRKKFSQNNKSLKSRPDKKSKAKKLERKDKKTKRNDHTFQSDRFHLFNCIVFDSIDKIWLS